MRSLISRNLYVVTLFAAITSVSHAADTASKAPKLVSPPLPALRLAATMITNTDKPPVSQAEFAFFEDITNRRQSKWTLSESVLLASGVESQADRQRYLARFDELTEGAREATADCETPHEKADALVHFLFKHLRGGFVSGQVDMRRVLDKGEYNCVSSAILFQIVSGQLGMKSVAAHVPQHVFVRIPGLDIEMIMDKTFPVAEHNKLLERNWEDTTQFEREAYGYNHVYETSSLSLIGSVYYDHAVAFGQQKYFDKAAVSSMEACCVDPGNPTNRITLEYKLRTWFFYNIDLKRFNRARNVIKIYAQLFGNSSTVERMASELSNAANAPASLTQGG